MEKYINLLDRHKYKIIVLVTLIVAMLSISLKNLAYEGNYKIWFDKDSKILKDYEKFRETFSGDDTFVVSFKDENGIFKPKAVDTIMDLTEKFKHVDGVQKVDSLSNYQYIESEDEDIIVEDFLYKGADLVKKREQALSDNLIVNQLISKDGKTTMLAVRLASSIGANENVNIEVMKRIEEIVKALEKSTGYEFYISGAPAITASLVTVSQRDAMILMPLAVVSVVSLLFVLFRSFAGVLIPSIVIVYTLLVVLSIQMLLGYKLNNFTVNIPAFISAVSIAGSMHLFLAWIFYKNSYSDNRHALKLALKSNLLPIGMTSLTTAVGFATLGFSKIEPISTLGIAITSGAIIAFLFTITLVPTVILMLKDDYQVRPLKFLNLLKIKGYGNFIIRNDKKIVGLFAVLLIVLAWGIKELRVDSNSIKYFKEDTLVRSGSDFIQKNLTGPMIYEVIVDSGSKEGIKEPKFLQSIIEFEGKLKSKFNNVTFTTSLKDIVLRMDEKLNPSSESSQPLTHNLVAQYLLLYSMSLPQGTEINDKVDISEQYLRVTLHSNIQNTSKDLELIDWIKEHWKTQTPYSADVQGQTAIFAYMQSNVTDTLVNSTSATLIIVAFAMLLIFKKLRLLLLFVFPNIAPVILVAGLMGYLGINIDIGISISAAVILGIAVDDTIHFFSKYFDAIKTKPLNETIDYILNHSGNAMIITTFVLSVTFAVFGVSSFIPNVNFAIVTIVALNLALIIDLVLLPAILSLYHKCLTLFWN